MNLVNYQQFAKLKSSKLVVMIGNILVDLFIFFTKIFIHLLLPNIMIAAKLSRYT